MGDRRMAEIRTANGSLYVYTHSAGYDLPTRAIEAIQWAKPRWNDHSYATRMIVDQITKPGRDDQYGYGLMLAPNHEDEYNSDQPSVIIDLTCKQLTVIDKHKPVLFSSVKYYFEDLHVGVPHLT